MKTILALISLFVGFLSFGQTWSSNVAEVFYEKCTKCHHDGGGAPFSLMTHGEVSNVASAIYDAVYQETMPPWPPNSPSAEFMHDRSLSSPEKNTILDWLTEGYPEGNVAEIPPPPVYNGGTILGDGELEIQIPTYMSKAITMDDYVCFSIPTNLTEDRTIRAVEVIPGNPEIVHHVLVYVDQDGVEYTDTTGGDCASPGSTNTKLVGGFTPGATPILFPSQDPIKLGVKVEAGAKIYLNMHYPIGSYGLVDSTRVIFHFYPPGESDIREIYSEPLLINTSLNLPPEQITDVAAQFPSSGTTPIDFSLYSIFPHMHLLGKEIGSYAIRPGQDTLPLIHIPHWDFDWQDFYKFRYLQKLPSGSKIKGYGTFDNTSSNIHNPNSPPIPINFGLNTTDEMFITYFQFLPYEDGDENYDLTELTSLGLNEYLIESNATINAFPNPFSDQGVQLGLKGDFNGGEKIIIYDGRGNKIKELNTSEENKAFWDGTNNRNTPVKNGVYYVSVNSNGIFSNKILIKTE